MQDGGSAWDVVPGGFDVDVALFTFANLSFCNRLCDINLLQNLQQQSYRKFK